MERIHSCTLLAPKRVEIKMLDVIKCFPFLLGISHMYITLYQGEIAPRGKILTMTGSLYAFYSLLQVSEKSHSICIL